jgi:hypothetical protein
MDRKEKWFLFLLVAAIGAVVIWELRSQRVGTAIAVSDDGAPSTAQAIEPRGQVGPAYLVMNQPNPYMGTPPIFNVMPQMARAPSLQGTTGCYACGD